MLDALLVACRSLYWRLALRLRGARVGRRLRVEGPVRIRLRDGASLRGLVVGDDVTLGGTTWLRLRRSGRIVLEDGVRTGTEVWLVSANEAELRVGEHTALGSYSIFNGGHGLTIGAGCVFAGFVYVNTSDHGVVRGIPIREQGFVGAPVRIGDDVWLGGHVFVGKGVEIGSGAVVGAGAIVVSDVGENVLAVGNPAKAIRERREEPPR